LGERGREGGGVETSQKGILGIPPPSHIFKGKLFQDNKRLKCPEKLKCYYGCLLVLVQIKISKINVFLIEKPGKCILGLLA
jgi:hypothetical protein